jgi:hypothetical protein
MVDRFRYTTGESEELGLRRLEELEAHIASGLVHDETLLFDAITGVLAPARDHDVYRFIVEVLDRPRPVRERGAEESDPSPLPDLGVTLVEAAEPQNTEAIVARLRRERDVEPRVPGWLAATPGRSGGNRTLVGAEGADDSNGAERAPAVSRRGLPRRVTPRPGSTEPLGRLEVPGWNRGPHPGLEPTPILSHAVRPVHTALLTATLVALAYLGLHARPGPGAGPSVASVTPVPGARAGDSADLDPVDALTASEHFAFHGMVDAMDTLARRHRVFRVPPAWLEGEYLADASAYPQVGAYWVRYLVFVRTLRREDERLFRRSFVRHLVGLEVPSAVVSLRLAQAMDRFESSRPLREAKYDRMEDLALAGIELHRLLVERDAELEYVPLDRAFGVPDPVLQVRAGDEVLQDRLYEIMDRIFGDLEAIHGSTRWTRDALNDGVLSSLRPTGGGPPAGEGAR